MNFRVLRPVIALTLIIAGAGYAWLRLSEEQQPVLVTGYVEGEALYFAAPVAGTLTRLHVERGTAVEAGALLFQIDPAMVEAQLHQAEAALQAAMARSADARTGQRPEELAVIAAQRDAAEARLNEARAELERVRPLVERGTLPRARLDQAEATYAAAEASDRQVARQWQVAQLGAREEQVAAADAEAIRARAAVAEIELRLRQLAPAAPTGGRIENVFFRPGEWVAANQPVLALLPDEQIKIRFFVPQDALGRYRPGTEIRFGCDGCGGIRAAQITYVSPRPEFTPPVIYSRGSREKLVYLVEATPAEAAGLAPGQPVDVVPLEG